MIFVKKWGSAAKSFKKLSIWGGKKFRYLRVQWGGKVAYLKA